MRCAYCGAPAIHMDHVVPGSLQKKLVKLGRPLPPHLTRRVPACGPCNWRKLTRRLVPPSWAHVVDELNGLVSGSPFRVWSGDPADPAFREVHR